MSFHGGLTRHRFPSFPSFIYRALVFILIIAAAATSAIHAQSLSSIGIKTDLGIYAETLRPALPASGGKVIDPVFGTEIMRVTDETSGNDNGTAYSYWPTFNRDNTRLMAQVGGGNINLFKFDPVAFQLGAKESPATVPGTGYVSFEFAVWSGIEPDKFFITRGAKLYSYHVPARAYALVSDLSREVSAGDYFVQMSKSLDDDVFAFTRKNAADKIVGYLAYQRSTKQVLAKLNMSVLDEVQLDKSGSYLVVKTTQNGRGVVQDQIVDLQTRKTADLIDAAPDHAPDHSDNGNGSIAGAANHLNAITFRRLATPHTFTVILDKGKNYYLSEHVSLLADNEAWALVSFYGTASGVFMRELVQVATDGSGRVRRLVQHRSVYGGYYDSPRANISRDGRFIAFTSNWGGGKRRDLFVARIEPPPLTRPRRIAGRVP
jgi:hypothetical protein